MRPRPNREKVQDEPIIIPSFDTHDRENRRDHATNQERNHDRDMNIMLSEPPAKRNRIQQPVIIDRNEFNSSNTITDFSPDDIQMPSIVRNQSRPSSRDQSSVPVIVGSKNGRNHDSKKTLELHRPDQKIMSTENVRVSENPGTPKWATEDQSGRSSGHEVDKIFRELNEGLEDRSEVTSEDLDSCLIIGEIKLMFMDTSMLPSLRPLNMVTIVDEVPKMSTK